MLRGGGRRKKMGQSNGRGWVCDDDVDQALERRSEAARAGSMASPLESYRSAGAAR
jgi:hypothetical protein